jgi:hypothetical protein
VLGDPGNASNLLLNVKKSAYRWLENNHRRQNFDLILTTGDNAYTSGKNQQYQEAIFNVHKEELSGVNLWPAYGNHDARRWAFFDIFDFPTQAQLGGVASTTEEYFSFNYADVRYQRRHKAFHHMGICCYFFDRYHHHPTPSLA